MKEKIDVKENELIEFVNKYKEESSSITDLCKKIEETDWAKSIEISWSTISNRLDLFNLKDDLKRYYSSIKKKEKVVREKSTDPDDILCEREFRIIKDVFGFNVKQRAVFTPCGSCPIKPKKDPCKWCEEMIEYGLRHGMVYTSNALKYYAVSNKLKWNKQIDKWYEHLFSFTIT